VIRTAVSARAAAGAGIVKRGERPCGEDVRAKPVEASERTVAAATYWIFVVAIGLTIACGVPVWLLSIRYRAAKARVAAREAAILSTPLPPDEALPTVLVQLPVYCESRAMVERALTALTRLDWPRDKLEIQLLDDSPAAPGADLPPIEAIDRAGIGVTILRRRRREGYKAGALANGLALSRAPYVAIFDADYQPPADWLRQAIRPLLQDPRLAFVQTRLTFLNAEENALTRALALNAHFSVWQAGASAMGLPVRCNGTGAIWRAEAIRDAGGWSGDTLAEDLDISIRAFLRGWSSVFVDAVSVPGELPANWSDWRRQQYRWAKGSAQALLKVARALGASMRRRTLAFLLILAADGLLPIPLGVAVASGLWFNVLADHVHAELVALIAAAAAAHVGGYVLAIWHGGSRPLRAGDAARAVAFELSIMLDRVRAAASAVTLRTGEFVRTRKSGAGARAVPRRRLPSHTA
jgi:hypothetical protein